MGWIQVSERRWERPISGLEGYFAFMANATAPLSNGREHYTMFSKLKLEKINVADIESDLKHAWTQLRYEQPQIATIVDGQQKVYEVPDETSLQQWLNSTFIVSSASDADELYHGLGAFKQATLYYLPRSSELAFRGQHYLIDGIGVLMLWDCYLRALSSPTGDIHFGDEPVRLAPMMEEVLGYPPDATKELAERAGALLWSWAGSIPGIGPVSKVGTVPPGQCQREELIFSTALTEELIRACRTKSITVTSAVHAAYIKSIINHADPSSTDLPYATANQFNLRRFLPEPYNTAQHAVSVFYTPIPFKLALPSTFEKSAHELNEYYKTSVAENPESVLELNGHFTRMLCQAVQSPEFQQVPIPRDALVSSLGIAEQYVQRQYGIYKVQDIQFSIDVVMGMSMLFVYTFQDQLRLVYCFNGGFEESSAIRVYLSEIQEVLRQELSLGSP